MFRAWLGRAAEINGHNSPTVQQLLWRTTEMKHLLSIAGIAAALVIAAPAWAQNPSGGNPMGTPGPNPGGPALTPYSGGTPGTTPPPSAVSPHHAVRHARAMHAHHMHMAREAAATGDATAQLNRQELARIQAGTPPAPPTPMPGK
jgi:hypothetical protein